MIDSKENDTFDLGVKGLTNQKIKQNSKKTTTERNIKIVKCR